MRVLALFGFGIWAIFLSIRDIKVFQISNLRLFHFLIFGYPILWFAGIRPEFSTVNVTLIGSIILFGFKGWIGMGDAKLIALLVPIFDFSDWEIYLVLLLVISVIQITLLSLRKHKIVPAIAWAPAILLTYAANMAAQFEFF